MTRATRFLEACRGGLPDCTPVWLMSQAGRHLPAYQAIRDKVPLLELCRTPELAAEVTVTAAEELKTDAAIIFSDLLLPLIAMGADVELADGDPRITPITGRAEIDALIEVDPEDTMPYVFEAIRLVKQSLPDLPLIGFAGGPLTLAGYLVEGGPSRTFARLKRLLFSARTDGEALLDKLSNVVADHLAAQLEAGCDAVQVCDSWAGLLGPVEYRELALPYLQNVFARLTPFDAPTIIFGTSANGLLECFADSGAEVVSVDWRVRLDEARGRVSSGQALQGNLDPACLFMSEADLRRKIHGVIKQAGDRRGYVFNLGDGILPETAPGRARFVVDTVRELSRSTTS